MKKFITFILLLFILFSCVEKKSNGVTVQISHETTIKDSKTIEWETGLTALEALQRTHDVSTHPIGKYVFVTKIDTVEGIRGVKAWYYTLNGKSTNNLAIHQELNAGDTITWIYKTDVCSCTVDKK